MRSTELATEGAAEAEAEEELLPLLGQLDLREELPGDLGDGHFVFLGGLALSLHVRIDVLALLVTREVLKPAECPEYG